MRLPLRRSTDTSPQSPEPGPAPEPTATTSEPPRPDPEPPATDVQLDALGLWDVDGSLQTATFPVTKLAVGYAHVADSRHRLAPGTKVILRVELPDGPCAVLGQAGSAAADTATVTVTSVERGNPRLRRFLADRAS